MTTISLTDCPTKIAQVVKLQVVVWGVEPVPAHQLIAAARNGGCILVAESGEQLLGFCYGFSAGPYLVSHMLAVHPEARRQGLAYKLKIAQWEWAKARGFEELRWTFDPLRAANARFNLHKLGATAAAYHPNYYGELVDDLNSGATDRLEIRWPTREWKAPERFEGPRISIPEDYPSPENRDSILGSIRADFQDAFESGFRAIDFRDGEYVLCRWNEVSFDASN